MFKDANSLDNHCRSAIHQGRNIDCPMRGCEKSFVSNAGLLADNIITNPSRLIGESSPVVVDQWATERAGWNGSRYECYLCPPYVCDTPCAQPVSAAPRTPTRYIASRVRFTDAARSSSR